MSTTGDTDTTQTGDIDPATASVGPANGEPTPVIKAEESKEVNSDDSIDESQDTTSRTSTRLVRFQLFETKAVHLSYFLD
jgi:hypothetical protein